MADATGNRSQEDHERRYTLLALRIMGEFGATIAVPAVVLALAGKWLDARYGTHPLFLVSGFALAVALTAVGIVKKARAFEREYRALNKAREAETAASNEDATGPRP